MVAAPVALPSEAGEKLAVKANDFPGCKVTLAEFEYPVMLKGA